MFETTIGPPTDIIDEAPRYKSFFVTYSSLSAALCIFIISVLIKGEHWTYMNVNALSLAPWTFIETKK